MDDFPKIAASNNSLANRKLIHGIGINDAWFTVKPTINGKRVLYKPYQVWTNMLQRCYDSTCQSKHPTYRGCTVCEEWLIFSNFDSWMNEQDWQGNQIDKDILKQGNKIYAPEYCRFISPLLNKLLTGSDAIRGSYPIGVSLDKQSGKYKASISINGKDKNLGRFNTIKEAKAVYNNAKYMEIQRRAIMQTDPEVKAGLLNWVVE